MHIPYSSIVYFVILIVHSWWTYSQDFGLLLEPQRAVGDMLRVRG